MPPRSRSNALALAVLACLRERPMHPYEVARTLRFRDKHESIKLNYGSLYSVVESLARRGMVRARETAREGRRPERTVYEITAEGGHELVDWLSDLLARPAKEHLQFEAALSLLAALPPEDAVELLRERGGRIERDLAARRARRQGSGELPRLFLVEDEYLDALAEAELRFVQALVQEIDGGTLSGLDQWRAFHEQEDT